VGWLLSEQVQVRSPSLKLPPWRCPLPGNGRPSGLSHQERKEGGIAATGRGRRADKGCVCEGGQSVEE